MAFIVKRDAVVIPAGIPVASTNDIIISNFPNLYGEQNAGGSVTCTKYNTSAYSNPAFEPEGSMYLEFLNNQWVFSLNYLYDGEPYISFSSYSAGLSSIIPIVGWSPIAITITVA